MLLSLFIGVIIGLVLGLTGAGGSIIALPLLVLLLGLTPHEAVNVALCAIAVSALFGVLTRLKKGGIQWLPALMFALIGSALTPLGVWLNLLLPETIILIGFFIIVLLVATKMWQQANLKSNASTVSRAYASSANGDINKKFYRDNNKPKIKWEQRYFFGMAGGASLVGILSGLFGVGGGFIIVPALMFLTGISIQKAVATSLVVISAVSASAILSYYFQGTFHLSTLLFQVSLGGLGGMILGTTINGKISGPASQKIFSLGMVFLSSLVIAKHFNFF